MRSGVRWTMLLPALLALGAMASAQDVKATPAPTAGNALDCSGTAQQCEKPAKFLTKTSECVCFTCGYGTPNTKAVCTKSVQQATALAELVKKSGLADANMAAAVADLAGKFQKVEIPKAAVHD